MPSKKKSSHNLTAKYTLCLTNLPREVITCSILPLLDHFSLAMISQTCTSLKSAVSHFLTTNRMLNMVPVSRRIELGTLAMAGDRKKAAFMFLTKNVTVNCLRKLHIDDHPAMPVASLGTIKKLVKLNKNLEELTLVNIKLAGPILKIISQLPKLKYLKLSPDICQDKEDKFSDFMEELEKKGCEIQLHYNYF